MEFDYNFDLALFIMEEIREEFKMKHFSYNLANTIKIYKNDSGYWCVEIPAQMYDFNIYKKSGAIVPWGNGSYASKIDETGGFSKTHKNYVDRCINKGIQKWLQNNQLNGRVR